jgi:cellulose synthase/poly-beta-1,6-N-acetylglucosamine synthase-like glycosyltransferase
MPPETIGALRVLFWILLILAIYPFVLYPALAFLLSRLRGRPVRKGDQIPRVSILIAAHNEAACIQETIANKLALDYPRDRLEIIVVSDASTDGTDDLVRTFESQGIRLVRQEERCGKTSALNLGVTQATGEILVFSDANSLYDPLALRALVRNFADESVGYVTGKMIYVHPEGSTTGEGNSAYMRYENLLREWETRLGSIVGVDGGVDAVRRDLYVRLPADALPDFALPLEVVRQGRRIVYEPAALLREPSVTQPRDEYRMRVRVALRALWAIRDRPDLLNPLRHGLYAWQLFSHKVLRYVAFLPLALLLAVNMALALDSKFYAALLALQTACYAGAFLGFLLSGRRSVPRWLSLPYYFVLIQAASCHAIVKLIAGQKIVVWAPRTG